MLQSRPEEITVQEVSRQEEGEDEGEVDDWITEHITHISRALTTEGFGNTTDTSSTEGFGDPTSTEEYIKSSFEEKNVGEKQSESAEMTQSAGATQPVEMTQSAGATQPVEMRKSAGVRKLVEKTQLSELK